MTDIAATASLSTSAFTTGAPSVGALLLGYSWNGTFGQSATVDYHFDSAYTIAAGTQSALVTQRIAAQAMQAWSNVANITFVQGASGSELLFTTAALPQNFFFEILGVAYSLSTGTQLNQVEIQIDTDYATSRILQGQLGYQVMLHEIGHGFGLKHPFDTDSGTNQTLPAKLDNFDFTLMSYTNGANVNRSNYATTPMVLDIAAAQYLYGANMSYHAGDDAYVINGEKAAYAIWDAGGNDSIIAGVSSACIIDLTDSYQFDNSLIDSLRSPGLNKIGSSVFRPAFNSAIEYASGNSGNDWIDGNGHGNTLFGQLGADVIDGWEGNDTLYGGRGVVDLIDGGDIIRGDLGADLIYGNTGNDTLFGGGGIYRSSGYAIDDVSRLGSKVVYFNNTLDASQIFSDAGDDSDTIYGGFGNDWLFGNGGNDSLYGGGASGDPTDLSDTIYGGLGTDIILSNGGNDLVFGGNRVADAFDGADTIYGGFGNDTIYGNNGDDIIYAGPGNDWLAGGAGNDLYHFTHGDGADRISSFESAGSGIGDLIYLISNINGSLIHTPTDVLRHISYSNGNALIDLGGGHSIQLDGVGIGLSTDDFVIV